MTLGYDPQYRPLVFWRWDRWPSPDTVCRTLDQLRRQEFGGVAIELPPAAVAGGHTDESLDRAAIALAAAGGAARGLMVWAVLPNPSLAGVNPLEPAEVGTWLRQFWGPLLADEGVPWPGLSGLLLPAVDARAPAPGQAWRETFHAAFLDQKGYVPSRAHEDYAQVRFDVQDVHTTLLAAAWYGVVGDWCDDHDLNLMACVSDARHDALMAPLEKYAAHADVPAVALPLTEDLPLLCEAVRSASVLSGRRRTAVMLEPGPLWGYSLSSMRVAAERLIAAGADFIVIDGFTEAAALPPAGLSPEMPQWEETVHWSRRVGRLCAIFAQSRERARVAVLKPTTSLWAQPQSARAGAISKQFHGLCAELDDAQVRYLLVDEPALARMVAVEGRLFLRGLWFDALIIPPLTHLQAPSVQALNRVAGQAKVFAFGAGGVEIVGVGAAFHAEPARRVSLRGIESILFTYGETLRRSDVFWRAIPRSVRLDAAEGIRCRHVEEHGVQRCLVVNAGTARRVTAWLDWDGEIHLWDAACECAVPAPVRASDAGVEVDLDLREESSQLVEMRRDSGLAAVRGAWYATGRIDIAGSWHFTPHGGNLLRLESWPAAIEVTAPVVNCRILVAGLWRDALVYLDSVAVPADSEEPRSFAIPGALAPGRHAIEIARAREAGPLAAWLAGDFAVDAGATPPVIAPLSEIEPGPWENQGFAHFSGRGSYTTEVDVPEALVGTECFLCIAEAGSAVDMEVNGQAAGLRPWPPYRVRVTEHLRNGPNLVTLTVSNTQHNQFHGPNPSHPSGLLSAPYLEFGTWSRSE